MNTITDLLSSTLTGLQLVATPSKESPCRFELFPELPAELRLKIFTHALPIPSVLDVNGDVVISDPSFGLYITFHIPTVESLRGHPTRNLTSIEERRSPKQMRVLSLLSACRESRDAYLMEFSIRLPYRHGPWGSIRNGALYVSKRETLHWDKLDATLSDMEVQRAMTHNYHLQDFWGQIERLALPITSFVMSEQKNWASKGMLQLAFSKMGSLKIVKGVMWKGYQELQDGSGKSMLESSMRQQMAKTEKSLQERSLENSEYKVPKFEIIF